MQSKKLVTAVAAVLVAGGAGAFIAIQYHEHAEAQRLAAAKRRGILNSQHSTAGVKTQPIPLLSENRPEPTPCAPNESQS